MEQLPDETRDQILDRLGETLREALREAKEQKEAGQDSDFSFAYGFSLVLIELITNRNTP